MIHYLYIGSIILSILIVLLFKNDLKKINYKLYQNINNKLYLKLYSLISIIFIHIIWLFNVFLTNNNTNNLIYGLPIYLILPYLVIIYSYINIDEYQDETYLSKIIDKIFNYLYILYFIAVTIIIIIPNKNKKEFIDLIIKLLNIYVISKFTNK
tara:strand:+ start:58 stop:519 length:462 start_codon:yes stop_codon:yes gene_type:complete